MNQKLDIIKKFLKQLSKQSVNNDYKFNYDEIKHGKIQDLELI